MRQADTGTRPLLAEIASPSRMQVAKWGEPALTGDVPAPRKGAAAATTLGGRFIAMFGGTAVDEAGAALVLDQLVVFSLTGPRALSCTIEPAVSGPKPAARSGAMLVERGPGQLFLYGGFSADGKPLNDAYVLNCNQMAWQRVYYGAPELVGPPGAC